MARFTSFANLATRALLALYSRLGISTMVARTALLTLFALRSALSVGTDKSIMAIRPLYACLPFITFIAHDTCWTIFPIGARGTRRTRRAWYAN